MVAGWLHKVRTGSGSDRVVTHLHFIRLEGFVTAKLSVSETTQSLPKL